VAGRRSPQRLPEVFRDLVDPARAFTVLGLELADGVVAPRVLVATDGKIAGLDAKERGPGGTPPPIDIREDEIVAARPAGLRGALGLARWRRRELDAPVRLRIRAWSWDPDDRLAHLRPLVRFFELKGNKLAHGFQGEGRASVAVFIDPLDFESLQLEYELPASLALRPQLDTIACRNTGAELRGTRGTKR